MTEWDPRYEKILRSYLPLLSEEENILPELKLTDSGLDSMATIQLLIELEDTYQVDVPDDLLNTETFSTVGSLWKVFSDTPRGEEP